MAYSGKFKPENLHKYKGDWRKIEYRSSWENFLFRWMDRNPSVKRWSSETVIIPYFSRADNKKRRYFMDLYVEMEDGRVFLFEVKPDKETRPPEKPKRITAKSKEAYKRQLYTYCVNTDKWNAAIEVCQRKGWTFKIITEKTLKAKFGWRG